MSLAARLDGIKIQGHRCAIRKKCALQKKGASTFWAATRLAPRGKTPRWRLRLPPRLTGSSSVPTTSRNVPNARSSSATGSRAVFPLEGVDAVPVVLEPMEVEGQWCLEHVFSKASAAADFAEAADGRVPADGRRRGRVYTRPSSCRPACDPHAGAATARTSFPARREAAQCVRRRRLRLPLVLRPLAALLGLVACHRA